MYNCPICSNEMKKVHDSRDMLYLCNHCDYSISSISALLNENRDRNKILSLRFDVTNNGKPRDLCPGCGRAMKAKQVRDYDGAPLIEVCPLCNYFFIPVKTLAEIPKVKQKSESIKDIETGNFKKNFRKIDSNAQAQLTLNKAYHENKYRFGRLKDHVTIKHMFFPELIDVTVFETPAYVTYVYAIILAIVSILYHATDFLKSNAEFNSFGSVDMIRQLFVVDRYTTIFSFFFLIASGRVIEGIVGPFRFFIYLLGIYLVHILGVFFLFGDSVTAPTMFITTIFLSFVILFPKLDMLGAIWLYIHIFPYVIKVWFFGLIYFSIYIYRTLSKSEPNMSIIYVLGISLVLAIILILVSGGRQKMYEEGDISA